MKKSTKRQRKSKEQKQDKVNTLKEFNTSYEYRYNPKEVDLVKNESWCRKITKTNCWRPDIYLDNERSCGPCALYDNCSCSLKRKKGNKL